MRQVCINAVEAAIGRSITVAESRNIEQRIRDSMVAIARRDPTRWQSLSTPQRMTEAANEAASQLVMEAQLKKQRLQLQIAANDRVEKYVQDQVAAGNDKDGLDALERLISGKSDAKNNTTSVEVNAKAIMANAMGRLAGAWQQISPRIFGLLANRRAEIDFARAAYGQVTGIKAELVQAANEWKAIAEALRERFNAAGGDIGKLDNWAMPQSWDQYLVVKDGALAQQNFVDAFMDWVDRSVYVHDDGRRYTDAEMRDFLAEAWLTISTNGANKTVGPNTTRISGVKANRGNKSRQLHFKDADSAIAAMQRYSGRSVFEAMTGHIARMSRDIALIEQFGPNADLTIANLVEKYGNEIKTTAARTGLDVLTADSKVALQSKFIDDLYNYVAGNSPPPPRRRFAAAMSMIRSLFVSAKLGSAVVSSISDEGTLYLTARVNRLPMFKIFFNEVRGLNPLNREEKQRALRAGLIVNSMLDNANRFGEETFGSQVPNLIASTVMRLSGLNAVTELRRRAFSVTMMDTIGYLTRNFQTVSSLDPQDWNILLGKGITQEIWDVWRAAAVDDWGQGATVLTPENIYAVQNVPDSLKNEAATKLMAIVLEERDIAVIEPSARERVLLTGGTQTGTIPGEILRSFLQFKTFPISVISKHWGRAIGMYNNTSGKAGYIAALVALQTVLGAVAIVVNDIASGRDPTTFDPDSENFEKNVAAATLKGGALGLYGDFLFAETTGYGRTLLGALGGPMVGAIEDAYKLTIGNLREAAAGEETDAGAEFARAIKGYIPGASIWYTKAALDRLIFNQLQEYFNPGYLARAKARAYREKGTTYWWEPGEPISEARAPELEKIVEE